MKVSFTLDEGSVEADVDPQLIGELQELLISNALSQREVLILLQQIKYFDEHRDEITRRYLGSTVVIHHEEIVFDGAEDAALQFISRFVSSDPNASPAYIVSVLRPEQLVMPAVGSLKATLERVRVK
jgi:hypothetical protein